MNVVCLKMYVYDLFEYIILPTDIVVMILQCTWQLGIKSTQCFDGHCSSTPSV